MEKLFMVWDAVAGRVIDSGMLRSEAAELALALGHGRFWVVHPVFPTKRRNG